MAFHRTRSWSTNYSSGEVDWFRYDGMGKKIDPYKTAIGVAGNGNYNFCDDYVDVPPFNTDHDLQIYHKRFEPARGYGSVGPYYVDKTFYGITDGVYNRSYQTIGNLPALPSINWTLLTNKMLANINPSNPKVDLPLFLFELRELPRMIMQLGNVLARRVSPKSVPNGYLAYQFGWAPLFSDLAKLINLAEIIEQRRKYLVALSKKGGKRVRRKLGQTNYTNVSMADIHCLVRTANLFTVRWEFEGYETYWGTARVVLKSPLMPADEWTVAARAALGLNLSAATIWNAIPWTWLIDYFVDIGGFLDANRNWLRFSVTRLNIMVTQQWTGRPIPVWSQPSITIGGGRAFHIGKHRKLRVPIASPLAFEQALDTRKLAILGAIAAKYFT